MKSVDIVVGTRPETIKMAPVYLALAANPGLKVRLISTGQHRELQAQAMAAFGLKPDVDLDLMTHGQTLSQLTSRVLTSLENVYRAGKPDLMLIHGDTTTAFSAALSGFYQNIPVAHVEAGLRTYNLSSPFPEEANRQLTAQIVRHHFAVDETGKENLVREGVAPSRIRVTGNTIGDAVARMLPADPRPGSPSVLVTLHRREARENSLRPLLESVKDAAARNSRTPFVFPVHPALRNQVQAVLGEVPNISLGKPLDYPSFLGEILRAQVVVTDSGGVQEEAYQLGRPVIVLREKSERSEGVAEGRVVFAGRTSLNDCVNRFLKHTPAGRRLRTGAAERIHEGVVGILGA